MHDMFQSSKKAAPSLRTLGSARRPSRVAEEVRRHLASILQCYTPTHQTEELRVTVSEVQMSKDLRQARVYVVPFMLANKAAPLQEDWITLLNTQTTLLQKMLAARAFLRFTPRLRFYKDTSFDNAATLQRVFSRTRHCL